MGRANHKDMARGMADLVSSKHHFSLEDRVKYIEKEMGDSAAKHAKLLAEDEANHKKISSALDDHGRRHATVEQRINFLEKELGDSADKHARALQDDEVNHKKISAALDEHGKRHASVEDRLASLEKAHPTLGDNQKTVCANLD